MAPDAFEHLKSLKVLDLGGNKLEQLTISGLPQLRRLRVNDNHLSDLSQLKLVSTPLLESVHLDHNEVDVIGEGDLDGLVACPQLVSLSLASNFISTIHQDAFGRVPSLRTLSLQQNKLEQLSGNNSLSFLHPLTELRRLYLSHNHFKLVDENDLASLAHLEVLALDHNLLTRVEAGAFAGCGATLKRLFLDSNRLYYLPQGLFDPLQASRLESIDLSHNQWECICGQEWLGVWLRTVDPSALGATRGDLGCLVGGAKCDDKDDAQFSSSSTSWMIVLAALFAIVTITSMLAIGYLLVQESCRESRLLHRLRRVPSDMVNLLPDEKASTAPSGDSVLVSGDTDRRRDTGKDPPLIRATPQSNNRGGSTKKSVRFDDAIR